MNRLLEAMAGMILAANLALIVPAYRLYDRVSERLNQIERVVGDLQKARDSIEQRLKLLPFREDETEGG